MTPQLIFSTSHVGHRLGVDRRTAQRHLEKNSIQPVAITVTGEPFYSAAALDMLERSGLQHEVEA